MPLGSLILALLWSLVVAPSPPPRRVLVVSIDGLSWPTWQAAQDVAPTLKALADAGVQAPLQTVFPSLTWPAHATLTTGAMPDTHKLVGNHLLTDKGVVDAWQLAAKDAIAVPTLYDVAHAAGLTTAAVLWPSTAGAAGLDWQIPEVYGQGNFDRGSTPGLLALLGQAGLPVGDLGRIAAEEAFLQDTFTTEAAAWLVLNKAPRLLFVHFLGVDTLSHRYGPGEHPPRWGLRHIDTCLTDLLTAYTTARLRENLDIIVVSDHGFALMTRNSDPAKVMPPLALKRKARWLANGQALYVYAPAVKPDEWPTLRDAWKAHPDVADVLLPADFAARGLPPPGADARMADAIVLAQPDVLWSSLPGPPAPRGMHGGPPEQPDLRGLLILHGPGVAREQRPLMHMRDVAPWIAARLQLPWPPSTRPESTPPVEMR